MNYSSKLQFSIFAELRLLAGCICVFILGTNALCYGGKNIIIATGEKGGTYWALGKGLTQLIEKEIPGYSVNLLSTSGSVQNVNLLSKSDVHIAFVQNDITFYAYHGQAMFRHPNKIFRGIASLYPEVIHIIVRRDSKIKNIDDLKGKTIAVGAKESGTRLNAQHILNSYNIDFNDIKPKFISFNRASSLLVAKRIDAIFLTAGVPTQSIIKLSKVCNLTLLNIDKEHIIKLIKQYPYYVKKSIHKKSYYGQNKSVSGIAVKALLVTSDNMNPSLIYKITKVLFSKEAKQILYQNHQIAREIQLKLALEGMPIYLNEGAKKFYEQMGIISYSHFSIFSWFLIIIAVLVVLTIVFRWLLKLIGMERFYPITTKWLDKIFIEIKKYKYFFGLLFILSLLLLDAKIVQYSEMKYEMEQPGATIQDYYDTKRTLLWLYVLAGCGYNEQRFPQSTIGKIAAASLPFISLSGLITLGGFFISEKIIRKIQGARGMRAYDCYDHIIICGWNQRVLEIVRGLTDPQVADRGQVIILAPCGENKRIVAEYGLDEKYVGYVNGKASNKDDLYKANIAKAKTALVIADFNNPHSDEITILSILNIESCSDELIALNKRRDSIYTIAELIHPENRIHLQNAKCDEIISTWDISEKLIIYSALNHGLSRFLTDILTFNESNEVYSITVSSNSSLIGKSFDQIMQYLRKMDISLLAIQCREFNGVKYKIITNPTGREREYKVQSNDKLILLAESGKAITKVTRI